MTTEKYLRQRVLTQNVEITTLTEQIDSITSTTVDLKEQVKELTKQLQDLKMDICRTELDKRLYD